MEMCDLEDLEGEGAGILQPLGEHCKQLFRSFPTAIPEAARAAALANVARATRSYAVAEHRALINTLRLGPQPEQALLGGGGGGGGGDVFETNLNTLLHGPRSTVNAVELRNLLLAGTEEQLLALLSPVFTKELVLQCLSLTVKKPH